MEALGSVRQTTGRAHSAHRSPLGTQCYTANASEAPDLSGGSSFQLLHPKAGCCQARRPSHSSPAWPASLYLQGSRIHPRPDLLASSWNHPRCCCWSHLLTCLRAGEGNSLGQAELAARPICLGICPPFPLLLPFYPLHLQGEFCACNPAQDHQGNDTTEPLGPQGGIQTEEEALSSPRISFAVSCPHCIPRLS